MQLAGMKMPLQGARTACPWSSVPWHAVDSLLEAFVPSPLLFED